MIISVYTARFIISLKCYQVGEHCEAGVIAFVADEKVFKGNYGWCLIWIALQQCKYDIHLTEVRVTSLHLSSLVLFFSKYR